MLVENHGRIVMKDELMNRLWPESFVGEANLTFNIQQLRRSLGDSARQPRYIETVAKRGYRFIASVDEVLCERDSPPMRQVPANGSTAVLAAAENLNGRQKESVTAPKAAAATSARIYSAILKWRSLKSLKLLAAVAVLGGLGILTWQFGRIATKNLSANGKNSTASVPRALKVEKLTQSGESNVAAISPDGKYLAYTRTKGQTSAIWLRQLDTDTNVELIPATGRVAGLMFANSGDSLYFVRWNPAAALYRLSLVLRTPIKILDRLEGNFALSSDDRQVAIIRESTNHDGEKEFSLIVASTEGGNERTLLVGTHPDDLNAPLWTPDDVALICAYGTSDGGGQKERLIAVRVADGVKQELSTEKFFHITKMAWLRDRSAIIMSARKHGEINQLWSVTYPGMEIRQVTDDSIHYGNLSLAAKADVAVAAQVMRVSDIWVGPARQPQSLKKITSAIDEFSWTPT